LRLRSGQVAVVTGAAGGIGRALCLELARRGCDLALVDRNEAGLADTAERVEAIGRRASLHVVDVADRARMERLPEEVVTAHGRVDLLVNNAGVSIAGPLESLPLEDWEWIVGINFWGMVYGCRTFLPHLRQGKQAQIVGILSDFALLGFPTKAAYCATKFAARGFYESLRAELHGTGVGVTCVYPGPASTDIARNGRSWDPAKNEVEARFLQQRGIPLERIAAATARGIERNAARVLIGRETCAFDIMKRLFPAGTDALVGRFWRRVPFL
jgi:short-subunit dehydrogenase